jgi:histidinol-phosphatase (PHP family)
MAVDGPMPTGLADYHVHSQWSWDASRGDMEGACRRAVELGLPSIAFTEHADWIRGDEAVFDAPGYFDCLERCRAAYPGLRILSGVEMGEPHRYPTQAHALLVVGFERVLGSVHCIEWRERTADASERGFLTPEDAGEMFRVYLADVLALVESEMPFEVLAHLDYPKRYWPDGRYDETDFEEEFRTILRSAARRGLALEVNTTRGGDPARYLCPGPVVLDWWREEGGQAVSLGSDAHSPDDLAAGFGSAAQILAAAGFNQKNDPLAFWIR